MSGSMTLHSKLGVNSRCVYVNCRVCGQEKSESLVMLGSANYKVQCPKCATMVYGGMSKVRGGYECPSCKEHFSTRVPTPRIELKSWENIHSTGVCEECLGYMDQGIVFISVLGDAGETFREWECDCGHKYAALVEMDVETGNLVDEKTHLCPKCHKKLGMGGPPQVISADALYRTGGFCVLKEDAVRRMIETPELCEEICRMRVAFVPDVAWDMMGLPRYGDEAQEETIS